MIDFTNIISKSWFWKIILFWIPNKNVFISRFHNYIFINWSWLWKGTLGNGCRSTIAECQLSTTTLAKGGKLQCIKFKVAIFKFQNFFLHECGKRVRIRGYSGPYFPTFGLNTERYGVSLRTQCECGKIRTRITPNTDTFHAVRFI